MTPPPDQHADLQAALARRLGVLGLMPESDPAYVGACDEVLAAGQALVEFEQHLPDLLEQAPHRISRLVLHGSGAAAVLAGLTLAGAALTGGAGIGWLPGAVAVMAAGALVLRTPLRALRSRHRAQRPGAVAVATASLAVLTAGTGDLGGAATAWLLVTATALAALGLGSLRSVPVVPPTLPRRRDEDP